MNNPTLKVICIKNPTIYNQLVEMTRDGIIDKEMIDHRNGPASEIWLFKLWLFRGKEIKVLPLTWCIASRLQSVNRLNSVSTLSYGGVRPSCYGK